MYHVYVLKSSKDGQLYIGCTSDIMRRLDYHNKGLVRSTKARRPFVLVYKEEFADKYKAFSMERFYKTAVGKRELKSKIKNCGIV